MAGANPTSVDDYIATFPKPVQMVLRRVRAAIRRGLPRATEVISYRIPAYRLDGGAILYFAGWKQHYSLYPASARLTEALKRDLAPYQVVKSTIRFPLAAPVPTGLIARIARFRAREVAERAAAKEAARTRH